MTFVGKAVTLILTEFAVLVSSDSGKDWGNHSNASLTKQGIILDLESDS